MRRFVRAPGALLQPLGEVWAAFSSLSGESHLVNDESASIVEALDPVSARSEMEVCERLAESFGVSANEVEAALDGAWDQLIEAGLIREVVAERGDGGRSA